MQLINRRAFFKNGALSSFSLLVPGKEAESLYQEKQKQPSIDLMSEVRKYRKIDSHAHVYFTDDSPATQIAYADRLHIEKLVISRPMRPGGLGDPDEFTACNDLVLRCMRQFPNRFIGQMTLNPQYPKESLEEIDRCISQGMIGLKVYNHVKINNPLFYPIIEKFIDLKMIILMHVGIGKSRIKLDQREPPNISLPSDFVEIANRYPEAMFQFAHLAGGEDWEDACKVLKKVSNVFVDVAGSNNDACIVDFALKYLGEDRIFFGCDNSFYQGVGHILAARLTETQRKKIFFENYQAVLKKSGRNVN